MISPLNSPSPLTKNDYVLHLRIFIVTIHCHVIWGFFIFTVFKDLETQKSYLASQLFDTNLEENTSKQRTKAAEDTHSCITDKQTGPRSRFKKTKTNKPYQ